MSTAIAALTRGGIAIPVGRIVRRLIGTAVFLAAVVVLFHPSLSLFIYGVSSGALYGLLAVAIILIYRTSRIVNFAAAALGAVPASLAVLLELKKGWPYWAVLPIAILGGPILGALADFAVIRRFATAPRLILTVATIGISQILALVAFYIPIWLGNQAQTLSILDTPWDSFVIRRQGHPLLTGDDVAAVVTVVALGLGLAAFLRYTRMGVALRASAENADRASLLGIPVRRVGTVAWTIAGLLAGVTLFLRAPIIGISADGTLGYQVLLFTLAAAIVARMEDIPLALMAGIGTGILEQASVAATGSNNLSSALMLAVILGALLLQKGAAARAYDTGVSTWQAVKEYRPIPRELVYVREVVFVKVGLGLLVAFIAICAPFRWLHLIGRGDVPKLTLIPIYAIVAVSLVILSGWAGQISLGQFALVGAGATIAGKLAAEHNIDFFAALMLAVLAGAVVAVIVGLPALRVQGLYLAVTTLALAGATEFYFLARQYWFGKHILPPSAAEVRRPFLWQRIDLESNLTMYYVCVAALVVALLAARAFRRNRSGRVLIAARDNQRAAPAYAINLARTKLAAFAISGALAGLAGGLLAFEQGAVDARAYGIVPSISVFVATVMGGLTSLPGAVGGAVLIRGVELFGEQHLKGVTFFVTGPGLLLILLFLPGGLAQGFYQVRDNFLRWVANRHGILVPSLVADKRVEATLEQERDVVTAAEHHVEETGSFDVLAERTISCPVCGEVLHVDDAPAHEHLRVPVTVGAADPDIVEIDLPVDSSNGGGGGRSRLRRARKDRSE
jgi:branched-chain amino acid transport system permease protein